MPQPPIPETMLEIIRAQPVGVLATVGPEGKPHCSFMSLLAADDGRSLYMVTGRETRKYRNLLANPRVSLLLDTRGQAGEGGHASALALEGLAAPLEDCSRRGEILARLLALHPGLADLAAQPGARVVRVRVLALQLLEGPQRASYVRLEPEALP